MNGCHISRTVEIQETIGLKDIAGCLTRAEKSNSVHDMLIYHLMAYLV